MVPLPFSARTTVAVAVFRALFLTRAAQRLSSVATTIGALNAVHAQLYADYFILITTPPFQVSNAGSDEFVPFPDAVANALTNLQTLVTLVQSIPSTLSNQIVLAQLQIDCANAVVQVQNAATDIGA
jgi:hypothetical protein